jgi:HEAT repeat protein
MYEIQKTCGACHRVVSSAARAGDKCPYCGAIWGHEKKDFALEALSEKLYSPLPADGAQAVEGLIEKSRSDHGPVIKILLKALKSKDSTAMSRAALALGEIGDSRAIKYLQAVLSSNNENTAAARKNAAMALEKLEWRPENDVIGAYFWIAQGEAEKAVAMGEIVIDPAIKIFRCCDQTAAQVLIKLGRQAEGQLVSLLTDHNWQIRLLTVNTLGKMEKAFAVEMLLSALNDAHVRVREEAVKNLDQLGWQPANETESILYWIAKFTGWELGLPEPADKLVRIGEPAIAPLTKLIEDMDEEVRKKAVEILGKIGSKQAVKNLSQALNSKKKDVRIAAARALAYIKDQRAISVLKKALKSWRKDLRIAAAEALAFRGEAAAGKVLMKALRDKNPCVRDQAVWGLGYLKEAFGPQNAPKITGRLREALCDGDKSVRSAAKEVLRVSFGWRPETVREKTIYCLAGDENLNKCLELGAEAVPFLVEAMQGYGADSLELVLNIVNLLGSIGNPAAMGPLMKLIQDPGRDNMANQEIREAAVKAIGKIGGAQAVAYLIGLAQDKKGRLAPVAVETLALLDSVQSIKPLIKAIKETKYSEELYLKIKQAICANSHFEAIEALIEALNDSLADESWFRLRIIDMMDSYVYSSKYTYHDRDEQKIIREVTGSLKPLLFGDKDPEVRRTAKEVLQRLGCGTLP